MKCCKEFLLLGGKQIPFCSYNSVGYREQARAQLDAMEPRRKQARRDGTPYQPEPVVFDFQAGTERMEVGSLLQIDENQSR